MSTTTSLPSKKQFGTFLGVYIPSVLTIFGVILYLRMGWIVGTGGLGISIALISLGSLITLITALSLSSITTNMRMKSGGVYFMLSRTFGLEIGGATCIPLYLSQALSVSFYIAGFAESIHLLFPTLTVVTIEFTLLGLITLLGLTSTGLILRGQLLTLLVIGASMLSLFLGSSKHITPMEGSHTLSFWALFAIFFPAVTGIESGAAMSGDLKNPGKSLPLGTVSAVCTGFLLYLFLAVFLSTHATPAQLISSPNILLEMALNKQIVLAGIWGASISSALSSLLAAPRTLAALSEDAVVPQFVTKKHVALLITLCITTLGLLLGGINRIAPVLSMFFLISYAMLNLATGLEGLFANPSWRPRFRFPWPIALFGTFLCLFCMLMINVGTTLVALLFVVAIYTMIKRREVTSNWGDIRDSMLLFLSRFAIYRLSKHMSPKCWRPNLLVFLGDPFLRSHLIELTQALTHEKGFLVMSSIVSEEDEVDSYESKLEDFFLKREVSTFVKVLSNDCITGGMKQLIKTYGLGSLNPNTIVLGATREESNFSMFAEVIALAHKKKKNVIIIRENGLHEKLGQKKQKHIDVWWGGINRNNSELMLVLAYMLQTSKKWEHSALSIKTIVTDKSHVPGTIDTLKEVSDKGRLHITPEVVIAKPGEHVFKDTMHSHIQSSDLVFIGLRPPHPDEPPEEYVKYYKSLLENTEGFPPMAFVLASEDIDFNQILE